MQHTQSLDFETKVSINSEGEHNEFYWSQEFPRAMEWLFFDSKEDPTKIAKKEIIKKTPLIDWIWLLVLAIIALATEWFTRKYNGLL